MEIQKDIPLAPFTTFKIGGPAKFFVRVHSVEELQEALSFAKKEGVKVFVLGGGSNVLVADEGFDGLVIKIEILGVEEEENTFIAAAGEGWDALVARAVNKNLWGIENLSAVPGTVGGAVVQNIGAYGAVLSQALLWVEVFDTTIGGVIKLSNSECRFGYRDSIFKQEEGRYVVLRAAIQLSPTPAPNLEYKDLSQTFAGKKPNLKEVRTAVIAIRTRKFPDLTTEGSAGSFFKNPILPEYEVQMVQAKFPGMPLFPLPESSGVKIPLAWFLDKVLALHGTQVGAARLFETQPLVIATKKGATAADVKKLAQMVQERIRSNVGIEIEPEVKIL